ncbi:hypothetical protein [Mycolicibacterium sp. lyk4-40-TYG-92]|uniref:hypothetical protein n=1 Tax=Mycolicibacterium sp. lyk4-40-TYG-92 TaxID=3040295 RepID=UPI00254BC8C4|nr:hypothetical protein [Mycolicibacterium sp. lyk4-40-TYG-92]
MHTLTVRLSLPTAAALMAASVMVTAPPPPVLAALPAPVIHSVQMPDIQLTATIADILQFPAFKQWVANQITDLVTIGAGLAKAGQGVGQTISAIPGLVVTATQQVLARDFVGALGTVEAGVIGAVTVIGGPILVSIIARDQRALAVDQALVQAVPVALIGLGTGLLGGFNAVATSAIIATQNVVAALLPINIGNLVTAVVDGIKLVVQGLNTGAGNVIDGIAFAQNTIAKALATQPAPIAAVTPTPAAGVAATAIPKITTTKVKPTVKLAPTAAKPTATPAGTKDPTDTKDSTAPDTNSTANHDTDSGTKPDTTGAATNSNAGTSDTGSKTEKQTTPKKPKTKSGKNTQGKKAASMSQAAA